MPRLAPIWVPSDWFSLGAASSLPYPPAVTVLIRPSWVNPGLTVSVPVSLAARTIVPIATDWSVSRARTIMP